MVETTVEVDAVTGMTEDESLQQEILGSIQQFQREEGEGAPAPPAPGGDARSDGEDAEDDEYDPFSTAPAAVEDAEQRDHAVDLGNAVEKEASQAATKVPIPSDVQEL